jgi:hypothetical protein
MAQGQIFFAKVVNYSGMFVLKVRNISGQDLKSMRNPKEN